MNDKTPTVQMSEDAWGEPSYEIEPLKLDMVCPLLRLSDPSYLGNNWSSIQCESRIECNSPCTKTCPVADRIRRKGIANDTK